MILLVKLKVIPEDGFSCSAVLNYLLVLRIALLIQQENLLKMKKVSFIKGEKYPYLETDFLPDEIYNKHFDGNYCIESFTAEITVKIVPYEQV